MNASLLPPATMPAQAAAVGAPAPAAGGSPAGEAAPPGTFAKALHRAARPASEKPAAEKPSAERAARKDAAAAGERAAAGDAGHVGKAAAADGARAAALPPAEAATLPAAEPPAEPDAAWLAALLPGSARLLPAPEPAQGGTPGTPIDTPPAAGRPGGRGPGTVGRLPGDPALTERLPREPGPALPAGDGRENLPAALPPLAAAPPMQAEPMPLPLAPVLGPPQFASMPAAHAAAGGDAATLSPAEARLALAPGHAGFAPALGATLATFVRQGIEHARLHLNPAEMGPVAVQIRLDGQAAQVLMSAAHADTRAALEQALPTLAGALREAGLTLAGGGVFEQPRESRRDDGGEGRTATRDGLAAGAAREAGTAATAAPAQRRGVVDLVA
jgi:flagellar hook-length control protein FliK